MRKFILIIVICCSLFVPALAAESPEALTVRVTELEKANFVLQEDLARTRIELDQVISLLQKTLAKLDTKTSEQNETLQTIIIKTKTDLEDNATALQKHLDLEVATRDELVKKINDTSSAQGADITAQKADITAQKADITAQKTLLASVQNSITSTQADITAQKTLLATVQDAVAGTKKGLQENLEKMQLLLSQQKPARNPEMEERLALMESILVDLASRQPVGYQQEPVKGLLDLQKLSRVEVYRLRIANTAKGEITVSHDAGASWELLGHVVTPAENIDEENLPRQWAPVGVISSTAITAIAIRTEFGTTVGAGKGTTFSILPKPAVSKAAVRGQKQPVSPVPAAPNAFIQTDIAAGSSIFGDKWTPFLGNPVYVETPAGLQPIPRGYAPKRGDALVICVLQPKNTPKAFIFENQYGGKVSALGWDEHEKVIGQVLSPVIGIARFDEKGHAAVGLSSSENGMLDILVAPAGKVGGFRILLCVPGVMNTDLMRERALPQTMVVGEYNERDLSWEGMAPLFYGHLHPRWNDNDWKSPDWLKLVTSRIQVEVRIDNGPWKPMPTFTLDADAGKPLPEWAHTALQNITHIRILLPVPPKAN